ncbi:MAG: 4-(cytidine 5'-diphospho)-2-C-methyl-D-erythritol kinase [Verrucomicrobiales bacterium]
MAALTHSLSAPAKINLSLRVLGRRGDGFHELETVMVPLGLADGLTMERMGGPDGVIEFSCTDAEVPGDESNLVIKALRAIESECGRLPALRVKLEKAIPHGAGLGGGSSDAAAALAGVNDWLALGLAQETLHRLAAGLGSDVPFFLHGSAAICRGRGEVIEPLPDRGPRLPVLLVKLPFPVPTPWAYGQWGSAPCLPDVVYDPQVIAGAGGREIVLVNDLERPVFAKHLVLATLKMWLLERPEVAAALMSGSGSTVFAVLRSPEPAQGVQAAVREAFGPCLWLWQGETG